MATGEALTWNEMRSWAAMAGVDLLPWEAELLRSLDRIRWKVTYE